MAALAAGGLYLLSRMTGKGGGGGAASGEQWQAFAPAAQPIAWDATTRILWAGAGKTTDKAGHTAILWSGQPGTAGGPEDAAQQSANDQWLREMMSKDYRILVSDRILIPEQGATRQMVFAPSGFAPSNLPPGWGPLQQLFAPAPSLPELPPGARPQGLGFLGQPGSDAFSEIADPTLQARVRALASDENAALRDLDDAARALDKLPAPKAAAALRARRASLAAARRLDAEQRGGYPFTVRGNGRIALDTPYSVARWYGGARPNVQGEMGALNPRIYGGGAWNGWAEGAEVLLPIAWFPTGQDPDSRGAPPLQGVPGKPAAGGAPAGKPAAGGFFPAAPAGTRYSTPWGDYHPDGPLPPGVVTTPGVPGTEPYAVPPSNSVPGGVVYGPAYKGKYTEPTPGHWDAPGGAS